jgi:glucans biosynthesis protein
MRDSMTHRSATLSVVLCLLASVPGVALGAFGFEDVSKRAQQLAAKSYKAPEAKLPAALRDIGYDAYRDIRFKADQALWRGRLPFEVQFFHPGFLFQQTVRINIVGASGVRKLPFDPKAFTYGRNTFDPKDLRDIGYAGFRVHYPLHRDDYKDEVAVFLGASYLRAIGRNQGYGLSARGLAVDTALPSGEEFPAFREFWLEWPAAEAKELVVYALLDSRRVTGAYRFVIRPGDATVLDVRARLFLRAGVGKLGIAPLTSMYFFGENQPAPGEDYRPEVHDSDGLLIASATGEWLWRPLPAPWFRNVDSRSRAAESALTFFGMELLGSQPIGSPSGNLLFSTVLAGSPYLLRRWIPCAAVASVSPWLFHTYARRAAQTFEMYGYARLDLASRASQSWYASGPRGLPSNGI